ncbi:hypothetical protein BH09BAC1_BH09BAC1_02460 [soil metagenome]
MSQYFSNRALIGLNRMGDVIIPRNGEFPSFSEFGGIQHIDDLAAHAPAGDIKDLGLLLAVLSFMPTFVLRWIVGKMEDSMESHGPLGFIFRQLDYGLRGIVFSCYYSEKPTAYVGQTPLHVIGFHTTRVED